MRDSAKTRSRLLEALGRILEEEGFARATINEVARRAGVDKVLIYRYFGGMPQLLRAYARQYPWPSLEALMDMGITDTGPGESTSLPAVYLRGLLREFFGDARKREIARWGMAGGNDLSLEHKRGRETQGWEVARTTGLAEESAQSSDHMAVWALLHAGVSTLGMLAEQGADYLGLSLGSEEGRLRLERALGNIVVHCGLDEASAGGKKSEA